MKALRLSLYLVAGTLLLLLALFGLFGVWSGASSSLATTLTQFARYLPEGQTLEVKEVEGTLRDGGHIGWLRWRRGELSVEAFDVRVAWALRSLLDGDLRFGQLDVRLLRIEDGRASSAPTVPTDLRLPIRVDLPFSVAGLEWTGPPAVRLAELNGHYIFDGQQHLLDLDQVGIAEGIYRVRGSLQAQGPLALQLRLDGSVQSALPASDRRVTVRAQAEIAGALAGRDATLTLQARLQPESRRAPGTTMQADITARIQPWQAQAVTQADARWQALDLSALWPRAPRTGLNGQTTVIPAGDGWRARITLDNTLMGPWNQQRLPLRELDASLIFAAGQWTLESLQASVAGGRVEARGQFARTAGGVDVHWQGNARAQRINPAALDTRLAATVLDGQANARQTPSGVAFEASLQAGANKPGAPGSRITRTLDGLRLRSVLATGLWQSPLLKLDKFEVRTDDAQLNGRLNLDTAGKGVEGSVALNLPGASVSVQGQISSSSGQGALNLSVSDAGQTMHWLRRWPDMAASLGELAVRGTAELAGRWQGGWRKQGQALQLQARLRLPRLELGSDSSSDAPWRLRETQLELDGSLHALKLTLSAQAENGGRRLALQARGEAGWLGEGQWQAGVDAAQLSLQDSQRPDLWTLQLSERLRLDGKQADAASRVNLAGGAARLSGPVPGTATLSWQPAFWSRQGTGGSARTKWQSQGRLQGLPLAWLETLGQTRVANLGLRGNLLFDGSWDAAGGDRQRLRAALERSSGDLQLQGADADSALLRAGARVARIGISVDDGELTASLLWDSEHAGRLQADAGTRLQWKDGAWRWPLDAPLRGTVSTQLPPISAWSLLAPPGWRLRGTLDAQATLAGTRGAPQWRGTLQARDVAVRSVADGIDFSQGTLKASLEGQRLEIQELTLRGAGGGNGGLLSVTGAVDWLPAGTPVTPALSRLSMRLEGRAQALRVSARADRRLVVSGQLTAQLTEARLDLRGALKADQALFILPEDTVPQLGEDVRVRGPAATSGAATSTPASGPPGVRVRTSVAVSLDPGPDFQVRGRGLLTRLAGSLELRSAAERGLQPRLSGELRTVRGSYKAYGQQLDIEEGVLRFFGPYDNPALEILAIRPNLQQRVGVQISGTALSPVLRLYAEPDLPEAEKLSWLVLGRAAASGGAEAALLQQAALALLGRQGQGLSGGLAQALGLDELSVRGLASSTEGGATAATVTLGKRVSRDFYVAYERSLAGTLGTFFIFYDLSRRFTLRAQTGEQSAVDLIFTLRYD